jgi:hypothetical protein
VGSLRRTKQEAGKASVGRAKLPLASGDQRKQESLPQAHIADLSALSLPNFHRSANPRDCGYPRRGVFPEKWSTHSMVHSCVQNRPLLWVTPLASMRLVKHESPARPHTPKAAAQDHRAAAALAQIVGQTPSD